MNPQRTQQLPRREIIRGHARIRRVRASRILRAGVLKIFYREGEERRAGFFVAGRLGNAVERNLMRRRMREAYRRMKADLPKGDIIFQLVRFADWNTLCEDFLKASQKLKDLDE